MHVKTSMEIKNVANYKLGFWAKAKSRTVVVGDEYVDTDVRSKIKG